MNQSEQFLADLCQRTFLSLWSVPTPLRADGKELCDLLVVCSPDVILFSVKEIKLQGDGSDPVAAERWTRRAITNSIKQIHGAERHLHSLPPVMTRPGGTGLPIPAEGVRRVHRIAVAFGGGRSVPINVADRGRGLVHIFDEIALPRVMQELDTVTDFVQYLEAKRKLLDEKRAVFYRTEEDLLAAYLANGRSFPFTRAEIVSVIDGWEQFSQLPEVVEKKRLDQESYAWDELIEALTKPGSLVAALPPKVEADPWTGRASDRQLDSIARMLAREDRFSRRILGREFSNFLRMFKARKLRSRLMPSPSGVLYVFLGMSKGEPSAYRHVELLGRCIVGRSLDPEKYPIVVGIAIAPDEDGLGMPLDAVKLEIEWSTELQKEAEFAMNEFGWYRDSIRQEISESEFPEV